MTTFTLTICTLTYINIVFIDALMDVQQPLVSVIIPAYNRRQFIEKAIQSVLAQSYPSYELIIVDDASTDGTAYWIAANYSQVQLIGLDQNVGAAEARNVGIRAAQGDLIAFLDSDDYWDETYLAVQVRSLQAHPSASFVFSNHREIQQDGTLKSFVYQPSPNYRDLIHRSLADVFIYTMSAVVVCKSALNRCGLLNSRLIICHDRELYIRLLQVGSLAHTAELLVTRVMHEKNISTDYGRWAKYVFMLLDIFFADPKNKAYLPMAPAIRSAWAMIVARRMWRVDRDFWSSSQMLLKAVQAAPQLLTGKLYRRLLSPFS